MNWQHTYLAMAPRAGRVDQLRDEANSYRQSRALLNEESPYRAHALRNRLAEWSVALRNLWSRRRRLQELSPGQAELHMSARMNEMDAT